MITVPQATEKIIRRSRYLTEALSKDLINATSLARYIHPEVEKITMKQVTRGSIMMAIKRYGQAQKSKSHSPTLFPEAPDMIVRSNLSLFYVKNSPELLTKLTGIEKTGSTVQKKALFSYGRVGTMILVNKITADDIQKVLEGEVILRSYDEVSSITLHLPQNAIDTPGIFNYFMKSLAWEGINLFGLLMTLNEVTLIFSTADIHPAFGVLQSLFITE